MAKTLTVEAPNVGGRPYYLCEDPVTSNRFKESPQDRRDEGRVQVEQLRGVLTLKTMRIRAPGRKAPTPWPTLTPSDQLETGDEQ